MLKTNNYPVFAPSNIPAAGGKYRNIDGMPVSYGADLVARGSETNVLPFRATVPTSQ